MKENQFKKTQTLPNMLICDFFSFSYGFQLNFWQYYLLYRWLGGTNVISEESIFRYITPALHRPASLHFLRVRLYSVQADSIENEAGGNVTKCTYHSGANYLDSFSLVWSS